MKILFVMLTLISSPAFAANQNFSVSDMRLSEDQKSLEVDVTYGGGCKEHEFVMEITRCQKSIPARCGVEVIDLTDGDTCRALISRNVSFSLEKVGLAGYADEATIKTQEGFKSVTIPYVR